MVGVFFFFSTAAGASTEEEEEEEGKENRFFFFLLPLLPLINPNKESELSFAIVRTQEENE